MKKIKNNILYDRRIYSHPAERVLLICGFLLLVSSILTKIVFGNEDLANVFWAFCISAWCYPVMMFPFKLWEGYIIEKDCIYYKYRFITHKLLYKDIKCIIIAITSFGYRTRRAACVVAIGGEQEKILEYCMNSERHRVLSLDDIGNVLGAEMGYYRLENFREMFKKGSSVIHDYGFVWNKKEMYKILEGFQGDYYVAASVIHCFRKKYDEIVKGYNIDRERIHIIDDSTNGKFRW